jgi:undecaprenyl-diphosphatase
MIELDRSIFELVFSLSHRHFLIDNLGIFFAKQLLYVAILVAICAVFSQEGKRRRLAFFFQTILAAILARGLVIEVIQFLWDRPRPFEALQINSLLLSDANSFPSGHAAFLFTVACSVFFWKRKWGMALFALAVVNAAARVFAGVHWPSDVIGGTLIGLGSAYLVHRLLRGYRDELVKNRQPQEASM